MGTGLGKDKRVMIWERVSGLRGGGRVRLIVSV